MVIPVYNEEKTIVSVLDEHAARLEGLGEWEIICLDDASTDGTWLLLKEYAARQPRLRLMRHDINRGISPSFQELFREAQGEYIYLTAGDGQWPAENLGRLLAARQESGADLVIGVRQNRRQVYGLSRRAFSYGFNYLAKAVLHFDVEDANGIKLGRREIFIEPLRSTSFFAELERLAAARKKGCKIAKAPVIFLPRLHGKPTGARWRNVFATLADFVKSLT